METSVRARAGVGAGAGEGGREVTTERSAQTCPTRIARASLEWICMMPEPKRRSGMPLSMRISRTLWERTRRKRSMLPWTRSSASSQPDRNAHSMRFTSIVLLRCALCVSVSQVPDAGAADNVRTAKRVFLENMAQGRFERLDEIYGPNFVAHGAAANCTLEQDNASTKAWRAAK